MIIMLGGRGRDKIDQGSGRGRPRSEQRCPARGQQPQPLMRKSSRNALRNRAAHEGQRSAGKAWRCSARQHAEGWVVSQLASAEFEPSKIQRLASGATSCSDSTLGRCVDSRLSRGEGMGLLDQAARVVILLGRAGQVRAGARGCCYACRTACGMLSVACLS
jgi:hypothetical protein